MERQQECAWIVAHLENPDEIIGDADEFLQRDGSATTGSGQGLTLMHSRQ